MHTVEHCPRHTHDVFDISTMPLIVRWAEEILYKVKADAIVACGHSGLVLAGALAYATRIPVIAVRKDGEPTVAVSPRVSAIIPNGPAKRWIWLDDMFSSGSTYRHSLRLVWERYRLVETPVPVACLMYNEYTRDEPLHPTESFLGCEDIEGYDWSQALAIPHYGYLERGW